MKNRGWDNPQGANTFLEQRKRGEDFFGHKKEDKLFFLIRIKRAVNSFHRKKGAMKFSCCRIKTLFTRIIHSIQIENYKTGGWAEVVVCVLCSMKHTKIMINGWFKFQSAFDMAYSKRGVLSIFQRKKGASTSFLRKQGRGFFLWVKKGGNNFFYPNERGGGGEFFTHQKSPKPSQGTQ